MTLASCIKCALAIGLAPATSWAAADLRLIESVKRRDAKAFEMLLGKGGPHGPAAHQR